MLFTHHLFPTHRFSHRVYFATPLNSSLQSASDTGSMETLNAVGFLGNDRISDDSLRRNSVALLPSVSFE